MLCRLFRIYGLALALFFTTPNTRKTFIQTLKSINTVLLLSAAHPSFSFRFRMTELLVTVCIHAEEIKAQLTKRVWRINIVDPFQSPHEATQPQHIVTSLLYGLMLFPVTPTNLVV